MARQPTKTTGIALTEISHGGQVEIDGVAFEAQTSGTTIAAGEEVFVIGSRVDEQGDASVLYVTRTESGPRPTGTQPATAVPSDPIERVAALERRVAVLGQPVSEALSKEAEGRIAALERRVAALRKTDQPDDAMGSLLLGIGQLISALGCIGAPIYAFIGLGQASAMKQRFPDMPDPTLWILIPAAVTFFYSAAMCVVFSRCKKIPPDK